MKRKGKRTKVKRPCESSEWRNKGRLFRTGKKKNAESGSAGTGKREKLLKAKRRRKKGTFSRDWGKGESCCQTKRIENGKSTNKLGRKARHKKKSPSERGREGAINRGRGEQKETWGKAAHRRKPQQKKNRGGERKKNMKRKE